MKYTVSKSIRTKFFVDNVEMYEGDNYSPNEQQDASEFMGSVLDKISNLPEYKETIKSLCQGKIQHTTTGSNEHYINKAEEDFNIKTCPELSGQVFYIKILL